MLLQLLILFHLKDTKEWTEEEGRIIIDGEETFYTFGRSLGIPGDYNNDGYNDLVVAGGYEKSYAGVYMFFGGEQISLMPDMILNPQIGSHGSYFGYPVTSCGDINDDGYSDLALGAGSMSNGKSLVYFGGPNYDSYDDLILHNPSANGRNFGIFTAQLEGDFNNDGIPDLAHYNPYDSIGGMVNIYTGGENMDNYVDLFLSDSTIITQLRNIEFISDFTEKGKSDLIIMSAYNDPNLLMFTGCNENKEGVDYIFKSKLSKTISVASGDFNNNGIVDVLTGIPWSAANGWAPTGVVQRYVSPIMTNVDEEESQKVLDELTISPNPANTQIEVEFKSNLKESITVTICNLAGTEVYRTDSESNTSKIINLTHLKSGVYIVSILSPRNIICKKIVKI